MVVMTEEQKQAQDKHYRQKYPKAFLSQFELQVQESSQRMTQLVQQIGQYNDEMIECVENTDRELEYLEAQKNPNAAAIPGEQINKILESWSKEHVYYDDDLKRYNDELWLSLKEFEKQIEEEERGYKIKYDLLEQKYKFHMHYIRNVTLFRIQGLETAIVEVQMKKDSEIERLQMQLCEIESIELNSKQEKKEEADVINRVKHGIVLKNTIDARAIINQMLTVYQLKTKEAEQLEKELIKKTKAYESFESRFQDKSAFYMEEKRLRMFYQKTLIKMVRDLNLFEDFPDKMVKFKFINEDEDDINYQRQICLVLENINLQQACIDHTNRYFGQKEGIKKIQKNLNDIGLIDDQIDDDRSDSLDSKGDVRKKQTSILETLQNAISFKMQKSSLIKQPTMKESKLIQTRQVSKITPEVSNDYDQKSKKSPTRNVTATSLNFKGNQLTSIFAKQEREREKQQAIIMLTENLKAAIKGQMDEPKATMNSGQPADVDPNEVRHKMTDLIQEIKPDDLVDFRFLPKDLPARKKPQKQNQQTPSDHNNVKKNKATSKKSDSSQGNFSVQGGLRKPAVISRDSTKVNVLGQFKGKEKQPKERENETENLENSSFQNPQTEQSLYKDEENKNKRKQSNTVTNKSRINKESSFKKQKKKITQSLARDSKDSADSQTLLDKQSNEQYVEKNSVSSQGSSYDQAKTRIILQKEPYNSQNQDPLNTTMSPKDSENIKSPKQEVQEKKNDKNFSPKNVKEDNSKFEQTLSDKKDELGGVCKVQQELSQLHDKKYSKILKKVQSKLDEAAKQMKMKALEIANLQDQVDRAMENKLSYDNRMEMFKAEIGTFFEKFNEQILQSFNLDRVHKYINSGGTVWEEKLEKGVKKLSEKEKKKAEEQKLMNVSFGNLIKPNFSPTGELMGFEIRHQLMPMMFMQHDFKPIILKRAIKACIYMNRLLLTGQRDDFLLKQVLEGELQDEIETQKSYEEVECQVEWADLQAIQQNSDLSQRQLELPKSPDLICSDFLKQFLIKILCRMEPQNYNKQIYYKMQLEKLESQKLLDYQIEDIFETVNNEKQNKKVKFEDLMKNFFNQIFQVIQEIDYSLKQRLIIENMLGLSMNYLKKYVKVKDDVGTQAVPQTKNVMCFTGNDLTPIMIKNNEILVKKSKNQLVLDRAMESEYKKTLDLMEEFTKQLTKIEITGTKSPKKQKSPDKDQGIFNLDLHDKKKKKEEERQEQEQKVHSKKKKKGKSKSRRISKSTEKIKRTLSEQTSEEETDPEQEQLFLGRDDMNQIIKVQTGLKSSIKNVKQVGGLLLKIAQIQFEPETKPVKYQIPKIVNQDKVKKDSEDVVNFNNSPRVDQSIQSTNRTQDPKPLHQFQSYQHRQMQTNQIINNIKGIDPSYEPPTKRDNKNILEIEEDEDPSRLAVTKKFNAILRNKLQKIIIKNSQKATEIDKIINSSQEQGYSLHFVGIDGLRLDPRYPLDTTSLYNSMITGTEFNEFKKKKRIQGPFTKINSPQSNSLTTRYSAVKQNKLNIATQGHSQNQVERYENSEQFTTVKKIQEVSPFITLPFAIGGRVTDEDYGRNTDTFIGLTDQSSFTTEDKKVDTLQIQIETQSGQKNKRATLRKSIFTNQLVSPVYKLDQPGAVAPPEQTLFAQKMTEKYMEMQRKGLFTSQQQMRTNSNIPDKILKKALFGQNQARLNTQQSSMDRAVINAIASKRTGINRTVQESETSRQFEANRFSSIVSEQTRFSVNYANRLNPLKVSVNLTSTKGNSTIKTFKNMGLFSPQNVITPLSQILKQESRGMDLSDESYILTKREKSNIQMDQFQEFKQAIGPKNQIDDWITHELNSRQVFETHNNQPSRITQQSSLQIDSAYTNHMN